MGCWIALPSIFRARSSNAGIFRHIDIGKVVGLDKRSLGERMHGNHLFRKEQKGEESDEYVCLVCLRVCETLCCHLSNGLIHGCA